MFMGSVPPVCVSDPAAGRALPNAVVIGNGAGRARGTARSDHWHYRAMSRQRYGPIDLWADTSMKRQHYGPTALWDDNRTGLPRVGAWGRPEVGTGRDLSG
ncbi:hypothetical protein JCM4814A_57510 [Streptomyces phaeofaciens JCM 4814]|uniref:Uncharacterized protein n=1 Tax=Streptomyces phaeofaciens TaxID=68254 RepID=A0A918HLH3_9ACTN|nr:hypothetical protein GCM10010226_67360 [Streptomyces phaeofaciens]